MMSTQESDKPKSNSQSKKATSRFRQLLLLCGLTFIVAVPFYIEFFLRRPVGEGPAGPEVDRTPFETGMPWSQRPIMLLGIGDSVTRGLGAKNTSHTFFNRLHRNPTDEFADMQGKCLSTVLPNLQVKNIAVSGSTSLDHEIVVNDQIQRNETGEFGIVVMTTGGNDLIHSYGRRPPEEGAMYGASIEQAEPWIDNFRERLAAMFDQIAGKFPAGCEIFVGDIYDPTDGVGDAPSIFLPHWEDGLPIHARYNQVIRSVAAERDFVHVVPLYDTFLGHGSHARQFWRANYDSSDPHYWFFTNIEDPNDRGYDAIRRVFLNTIVKHRNRFTHVNND